jgi:hypothetical protein
MQPAAIGADLNRRDARDLATSRALVTLAQETCFAVVAVLCWSGGGVVELVSVRQ